MLGQGLLVYAAFARLNEKDLLGFKRKSVLVDPDIGIKEERVIVSL